MRKIIDIDGIKGIKVGHAQNESGGTGCTVILCEKGAVAGVDVRGGGPATRETDLLNPLNMVEAIHGVILSGGSAFGLDAATGVMAFLEEKGAGFDTGAGMVPIVCGASLFDLGIGDAKCRPDAAMGYQACVNAEKGKPAEGNAGAGMGASVGKLCGPLRMMKSGIGIYGVQLGALQMAAVVAVNALGDVIDVDTGKRIAGLLNEEKTEVISSEEVLYELCANRQNPFSANTTIGCIVTNAKLTKAQAGKVASMAHDGYARAIRPVHTSADGDTIFVMATHEAETSVDIAGTLAADVMARAVNRAVELAKTAFGIPAADEIRGLSAL